MSRHVVVIGGGSTAEHEVSLATAAAVERALRANGFTVTSATIGRDGRWSQDAAPLGATPSDSLSAALPVIEQADVVFPAIHGVGGEDGTLAALCALLHKPVVGSGLRAGAIGMDKWATKATAQALGIRTAPGRLITAAAMEDIAFERPVVVKPASAGSSYGVGLAEDAAQFRAALAEARRFDDRILVEDVVVGREIDVAVLREADGRTWAPPPLEIHAQGLFDTATKYDGSARFVVPADVTEADCAALTRAALDLFDALGCAGVARLDFFLTQDGPVLNEINTMPGMTAESQVPRMFAAAGTGYEDLVTRLVDAATVPAAPGTVFSPDRG